MFDEIIFGSYKLVKKIATSSTSEVFVAFSLKGEKEKTTKPVIVKKLLREISRTEIFSELIENEARLSKIMNHPNIVRFYESGRVGDELFIVMEYVDGLDLWRLLKRLKRKQEKLPHRCCLYIIREVLKALDYIHELRDETGINLEIVHHDVSPSNILISRTGDVKLGDFGISFSQQKDLPDSERKIKFRGKYHYVSPEQIKGHNADRRSDIFSVGVILTEILMGRRAFEGPTDLSVLINIKDGRSQTLKQAKKQLPALLYSIIANSVANHPEDRYQSAKEMLLDIEKFVGDEAKFLDAGIQLGRLVNSLLKQFERTPPPRSIRSIKPISRLSPDAIHPTIRNGEAITTTELEKTPIQPTREYLIKKPSGEIVGAMPLSRVIEKVISEEITEDDLISVGGGPFQVVAAIPEFARHLPSVTPTTKILDVGPPDKRGAIGIEESVTRIFLDFYRTKATGLCIFECGSIRKEIHLEEGNPCYASSNIAGELLGEYMVKKGIITRMELNFALAMMEKFSGHLGETLISLEIVDSITLLNTITQQIKERIYDIYTWEKGFYSFYKNAKYTKEGFKLAADPLELIKEGFLSALTDDKTESWCKEKKFKVFKLKESSQTDVIDEWKIEQPYRRIISRLEKPKPLFELLSLAETLPSQKINHLKKLLKFGIEVGFVEEVK